MREWSNLAKIIYKRTYSRVKEDGSQETWEETVDRVVEGNVAKFRGTKHLFLEEEKTLKKMMLERKAMPAGRGLWLSGTDTQKDIGGMGLNNPLHIDTKILTKEFGWITLSELKEGQKITVLSSDKLYARDNNKVGGANALWVQGIVSHTELQKCKKITYEDKSGNTFSVIASNNHRWFVRDTTKTDWSRVTTEQLKVGYYMPRVRPTNYFKLSKFGQQHGFHFGDGTRSTDTLFQFGDENIEVGKYLFGEDFSVSNDVGKVTGVPNAWSKVPENNYRKDKRYLYGFLSGYFCADGHVTKEGQCVLSSARLYELEEIKTLFSELGIMTGDIYLSSVSSNYKEIRELYSLSIVARDLDEKFFLKESHRKNWLNIFQKKAKRNYLQIIRIEDLENEEPVACVSVPYYEQFVIDGFCLTSNCSFFTINEIGKFSIIQDYLMLGAGVGVSVEHKYVSKLPRVKRDVVIQHKNTKDAEFIVPDSREGWCQLTSKLIESFFVTGKGFDYSTIVLRGAGEPIKRFGGKASGAIPLIQYVDKIKNILLAREGKAVRPIDVVDIVTAIGEMVVSGNVRRSAIIILGDAFDKEYLQAKRWDLGVLPSQRSHANFSVVCDDTDDLHPLFWKTYEQGEPFGIINVKNMKTFGRIGEKKLDNAIGTNPCAEIPLADGEICNLQELILPNIDSIEELKQCAMYMHRYGKRVSMEDYHEPITDKIVKQNRRIGTGITGVLQSKFTWEDLNEVYKVIEEENKEYSRELGINESIRTTTVKPSGTVSLLADVTAGIHPAYSKYYIRRVRFASNDSLIPILKEAGHPIEPAIKLDGTKDMNTSVVSFFCRTPDGTPVADEDWGIEKQLEVLLNAQKYWSDNSVSVTIYYDKETDIPFIKEWLAENLKNLKSISFLSKQHGFVQAPYEAITEELYNEMSKQITDIDFDAITVGELDNGDCDNGSCPIK